MKEAISTPVIQYMTSRVIIVLCYLFSHLWWGMQNTKEGEEMKERIQRGIKQTHD